MGLSSEPVAVPSMVMRVYAYEVDSPPAASDLLFSTASGFHAARLDPDAINSAPYISPGSLLSRRGHVVYTNAELTAMLGIMPPVPDLGLDAVIIGPREIWFSFADEQSPVWSERLGTLLRPGDLLSDAGRVVRTNARLVAAFHPMPPVGDYGLDAVARGAGRAILFSTRLGFFSESLGAGIGHGDLLSETGRVVRTNAQLLEAFHPVDAAVDYGLDAVIVRPFGEIWFSTETGFTDAILGSVGHGDLLSSNGYVVARNLDLLQEFGPLEDAANFGLDAAALPILPCPSDIDQDGDTDGDDVEGFRFFASGPGNLTENPELADFDGDGDADQADFGFLQRCLGGPDSPVDSACGEAWWTD
jgi:hypothetical protein